jgi:DNA-binding NarL/FixJ family response regulator
MSNRQTSVCIIAPPGRLRDGLRVLLGMNQEAILVGEADSGAAGLEMITHLTPDLVVIDASLPDNEIWSLPDRIRSLWPRIRCFILTHTYEQECRARTTRAEVVLPSDFSVDVFWKFVRDPRTP